MKAAGCWSPWNKAQTLPFNGAQKKLAGPLLKPGIQ